MNKSLFILTLAFACLWLAAGCGPAEAPAKIDLPKTPEAKYMDDVLARTGGDINKLTPAERQEMDRITRGNTEMVFKTYKPK
jgi:hypothetical protein